MRHRLAIVGLLALGSALALAQDEGEGEPAERSEAGEGGAALYDRFCVACHGETGTGAGPGAPWLWPRPRDFTRGDYRYRTTASGLPPTDDDLRAVIRRGIPGTSMHAFGATLGTAEIDALLPVLKSFSPRKFRRSADPVPVPSLPPAAARPAAIERGKAVYARLECASCHGESGRGDGPSAATLKDGAGLPNPPFDLTTHPLKRPNMDGRDPVLGIYLSLATGLSGTAMPAFEGSATTEELLDLALFIDSIRFRGVDTRSWRDRTTTSDRAIGEDLASRGVRGGYWPGEPDTSSLEERIWGQTLAVQGQPPDSLAPAQASLSAKQCARCHAAQYRQWQGSLHAHAQSPGLVAQLLPMEAHKKGASIESCQRCHSPLAEQLPAIRPGHLGSTDESRRYQRNPFYDPTLRDEGITCAACHLRSWTRHGPELAEGTGLLPLPGYPRQELAIYERSDFCLGCHQLPPRLAVEGRPLLNTYREWLEGPYMKRGIQCQHCHMSNREHEWKGVHDPDTFRQGIGVEAITARKGSAVHVRARVRNRGAGHFLPTTPTPAAWLVVELVDAEGEAISGAMKKKRIGRHLEFTGGAWNEIEDTRIPPGEALELAAAWEGGRTAEATHLRVRIEVHPDDYYEGLYRGRLKARLPENERALFAEALRRAEANRYRAFEATYPIASRD